MADKPDVKQEYVYVLHHTGNSVVLAVYSSEAKAEHTEYNFNPFDRHHWTSSRLLVAVERPSLRLY